MVKIQHCDCSNLAIFFVIRTSDLKIFQNYCCAIKKDGHKYIGSAAYYTAVETVLLLKCHSAEDWLFVWGVSFNSAKAYCESDAFIKMSVEASQFGHEMMAVKSQSLF